MIRQRWRRILVPLAALCALAACTAGPDYRRPETATPDAYAEAGATARTRMTAADADISTWWTQFGDRLLDSLIIRGLAGSLTLRAASARIDQARFETLGARAGGDPAINATGAALRYGSNAPGSAAGASGGLGIPSSVHSYSAGFDASWEVDFAGGRHRTVQEAVASEEVTRWARRDAEVSLSAEIARAYLDLRGIQARILVTGRELERQGTLLGVVRARRATGYVTQLDVHRQASLTETTRAALPPLEAEASAQIHALGILVGASPEALTAELTPVVALPPPPPELPLGLPAELLLRRPDLREAERRLAASNAHLGVELAAGYPKIDLLAITSFAGMSLGNLLSSRNLLGAGLGLASFPVYDAGRRRAAVGSAEAQRVQAELAYREAVLLALRDVEDALARLRAQERRRTALVETLAQAQAAVTIAGDQYRVGTVGFIDVLQAQGSLLDAEDALVQCNALALTGVVAVYKALGGGWHPE